MAHASNSRRGRHGRRLKNEINVVPYIDVMLVLLVIFMVTAPMITPGQIELPSVGSASVMPAEPVEVQISQSGSYAIRTRSAGATFVPVAASDLVAQVSNRLTPDVPYEAVMKVMDELRRNGIHRLGLLVDQRNGDGASPTPPAPAARQ